MSIGFILPTGDEFFSGFSAYFCGAQVTMKAFESRARLFCAKLSMQLPILSIQLMIDA